MVTRFELRAYATHDREALRATAAETVWLGDPRDELIPDRSIWAELTTRFYTDREPEHAWVAVRPAEPTVYAFLTGTVDVARYGRFLLRLAPSLALRGARLAGRAEARRAAAQLARAALRGELVVPAKVRAAFPATFRFAMRPEARGQGLGARLVERYLTAMQAAGVRGVHAQTVSADEDAARLLQRAGFQLAASWPLTVFAHAEPAPLDLRTWVRPI